MRWIRRLLIMVLAGMVGGSVLAGCSAAGAPPPGATVTPTPRTSATSNVVETVEVANRVVT